MSTTISWQEFTTEEAWMLKKRLMAVGIFFVFATTLFGVFINKIGFHGFDIGVYVFGGFAVFFYGIIFYMAGILIKDLFRGEKMVIKGVVTDKKRHKSSSSRGTRSGGRGGSSSRPKYYLFFGDDKYYVEQKHFNQSHVGLHIELHYAKSSSTSLGVINTENSLSLSESRPTSFREFLEDKKKRIENLPKKETVMSETDLGVLKNQRNRSIRGSLMFILPFGFMAIVFSFAGLLWWVMAIPAVILWLVFLGFARHIFRIWGRFKEDERSRVKLIVLTKVVDKQVNTGSYKGQTIETEYGSYSVSKDLYNSLTGQEQVILSVGKHSGWLIDIQTKEN